MIFSISNRIFAFIDTTARRRFLSIFIIAFFSFAGSWIWALFRGIHFPYVHDELSYLLAGDTFAHGRITNPTHPMWKFFETFYVLQRPTYMSMYPPGQGAFLALGQVFFGHPIYGVWLSSAFMCAAICWMLYAWVSPRWALMGGLVAVSQFGIFTYWNQNYWGGAVAALGGALVLGALPRIFKMQRIRDVLWLGLGGAVLANSRPFEGFFIALPVACLVLPWKIRWKKLVLSTFIRRIILPLSLILFMTAWGMGAYNKQITGNAMVSPYVLYKDLYKQMPIFIFQPLRPPPHYNNKNMDMQERERNIRYYAFKRTWVGFLIKIKRDSWRLLEFYFWFPLAFPCVLILLLLFSHPQSSKRFILALFILLSGYAVISYRSQPHYYAPLTCLAVLLITVGLRGLAGIKFRHLRIGSLCVILLIVLQLAFNIIFTPVLPTVDSLARSVQSSSLNLPPSFTREGLRNSLIKRGGKYLVIVKYQERHNFLLEWVYNDADIDHAPIVWAQDRGDAQNKELLEYFKNRQVLFIQVYWDTRILPALDNRG